MADCKNQGMDYLGKSQSSTGKISPPLIFTRSKTINSSSTVPEEAKVTNKPLYDIYSTPAFQRGGSFKNVHGTPFGSMVSAGKSFKGKVRKMCSIFESPKQPLSPPNSLSSPTKSAPPISPKPPISFLTPSNSSDFAPKSVPSPVPDLLYRLPGTEDRVVIYFTSLRGIRKTFQDGHSIRMIFRGFRVNLDERDVSMDIAYKNELQKVLGKNNVSLPQVFIKGKHIGGADVIKQLLEVGELRRLLKGLPSRPSMMPCDACGDMRFIPCTNCNGSRKVFDEDDEQARRCTECNENGLEHCPLCGT